METEILISGGYVPKNHDPYNIEAIEKWMESLPPVRCLKAAREADEKYEFLKLKST